MLRDKIEEVKKRIGQLELAILRSNITETKSLEMIVVKSVYQSDYDDAEEEQDEAEMLALTEAYEVNLKYLARPLKLKL